MYKYDNNTPMVDYEKLRAQLETAPLNEETIRRVMTMNDGILNGFIYYLAVMW